MARSRQTEAISGLQTLVQELGHQLPLLDAKRAGEELYGAPRLSFYELVKPNEPALSRIISDLIDPRGMHGQGPLFLNALLSTIGLPRVRINDPISVGREVRTNENRRIDIVIETPSVLLGIENKPWAVQQPNQLEDYHRELHSRAGKRPFSLVFLSDQTNNANLENLFRLPYQQSCGQPSFHSVLTSVLGLIKATRTHIHVSEFLRYIDIQFGEGEVTEQGDEPYLEAVQTEFSGGAIKKKALAVVLLSQKALHARILDEIGDFLVRELRTKVKPDFSPISVERISDRLAQNLTPWEISRPSWPKNCSLCLESEKYGFRNICLGVRAPDPNGKNVGAEVACQDRPGLDGLTEKIPGGGKTVWWPWLRYVASPHWGPEYAARLIIESPTAQVDEHQGIQELARQFVQLAEAVEECLNQTIG